MQTRMIGSFAKMVEEGLCTIDDLPEEYRNACKYSPKQQIGEGEEFMDNKKIIHKDNLGRETPV